MIAIILAAGSNNEVSHLVGDIPKNLIEINGSSILEIQLNVLHSLGIDNVCVVKGYKEEMFSIPGIKYYTNDSFEDKDILYSMFCAEKEFTEDILIIYGDVVFDKECLKRILTVKSDIAIGVALPLDQYKKKNINNLELASIEPDNTVSKIGKDNANDQAIQGQFSGIMKCTKQGIEILKNNYAYFKIYHPKYNDALISDLLENIIKLGVPVHSVLIDKGWVKINAEEDYRKLLNQEDGAPNVFKMQTDWAVRANLYNNIQWVNKNEMLDAMIDMSRLIKNPNKILDIGVGTGKVLIHFKEAYPEADFYGIDISPDMMSKIDNKYQFNLSVNNAEDLHCFEDNSFDIVTARMSMHHVEKLMDAALEVKRILKTGGIFIICEGVPPEKETLDFYKEMFAYKETRNTFLTDDLINLMCNTGFDKVMTRTIIQENMSMNNWLANSGIPERNKDIISKMHYDCSENVKRAYKMQFVEDDILMEWKFVVVAGIKK